MEIKRSESKTEHRLCSKCHYCYLVSAKYTAVTCPCCGEEGTLSAVTKKEYEEKHKDWYILFVNWHKEKAIDMILGSDRDKVEKILSVIGVTSIQDLRKIIDIGEES